MGNFGRQCGQEKKVNSASWTSHVVVQVQSASRPFRKVDHLLGIITAVKELSTLSESNGNLQNLSVANNTINRHHERPQDFFQGGHYPQDFFHGVEGEGGGRVICDPLVFFSSMLASNLLISRGWGGGVCGLTNLDLCCGRPRQPTKTGADFYVMNGICK